MPAVLDLKPPSPTRAQLEEWGIDLRGRHSEFYGFFLAHSPFKHASRLLLGLGVNVGAVWAAGLVGAAVGTPAAGLPLLGTIAVNAVVHAGRCLREGGAYHPGLASAVLLFIPFTVRL
jgi:hypothetical protein